MAVEAIRRSAGCLGNGSGSRKASLGSPTFQWSDRSHDISDHLYFAGHVAEDFVGLPSGWDQPDDGFAVLGDQHRLTAVQDLIHNRQAVRFELTGICFTKWCILL
jgi:hypothetical protein